MGDDRRVVVTGLGPITAVGIGGGALWQGIRRERSGVTAISRFDATPFRSRIAAEVPDFEPADHLQHRQARKLDRYSQFAVAGARLAIEDAGLPLDRTDGERVAVQVGSALGGLAHAEEQLGEFLRGGPRAVDTRLALTVFGGAASCNIAMEFGFTGPNATNSMSCASGTVAVGEGWRLITEGTVDVAIAGGVEAPLAPLGYGAFALIRAMSTRNDQPALACRPFDRDRDGFVMGEGACLLVLEEREHALARGATVIGEIAGYGTTNDAYHMTAPRPDGTQAARSMRRALASAGFDPEDIQCVKAHGSSTPLNDSAESSAIRQVLGDHADAVPVFATKPFHGHALGASGAIELAIVLLSNQHAWIPPTLNLDQPGAGCDLDYVARAGRPAAARWTLCNSFGFGGINASLVVGDGVERPAT